MTNSHFHLYHHQPDPLPPEEITDQAWLLNNARTYSLVAQIIAPGAEDALRAAQARAQGQQVARTVKIQAGNLLRQTLPGDVLITEEVAWMVDAVGKLHSIPYQISPCWKHVRQRPGQQATVDTLAWSPDGTILAASASDRRVVFHVLASEESYPRSYERGEGYSVTALAWSPGGSYLAAAHGSGDVHVWKPAPGQHGGSIGSILICRTEETSGSHITPQCLAWAPNCIQLFAGRADGTVVSWDIRTGTCFPCKQCHQKALGTLAFSRHTQALLTASIDGSVRIWNHILWDHTEEHVQLYQHTKAVMAAVWSPDGQLIASCEHADPTIHVWQAETGMLIERIPLSISSTELLEVHALAWSPHGRYLAAGCDDSTIQLIDVRHCQHIHTYRIDSQRKRVAALAWSPDSAFLAAGDGSVGIRIWQVAQDIH